MRQFQKIAIGLLGLTNPEMFIPMPKSSAPSAAKIEHSASGSSPERREARRGARAIRALKFTVSALALGSRTVPLADNNELRNALRRSASLLYGSDQA